jgi:hypothetical protein
MPANDLYEVLFDQVYGDQRLNTSFYLFQESADGGGDARVAAIDGLFDKLKTAWSNCCTDSWAIVQVRARRILPVQTQPFYSASVQPGAVIVGGLPPQSCAVISQKNSTTGQFGNGRVFLSAIPKTHQSNGRNTLAAMDLLTILADLLVEPVVEGGYTFTQGIYSQTAASFYKTTQVNVEGTLANLNSRKPPADVGA